jgi:hypothetical protein
MSALLSATTRPSARGFADRPGFDGEGRDDVSVFRPSNGTGYMNCTCGGERGVRFAQAGDVPIAADYDDDGKTDQAVFRAGTWLINRSSDGQFQSIAFGTAGDIPTVGDYDGDEKRTFGLASVRRDVVLPTQH